MAPRSKGPKKQAEPSGTGYVSLHHLPFPPRQWVNDVWLVPISLPAASFGAYLQNGLTLNGYEEKFVEIGSVYQGNGPEGDPVPPRVYVEQEISNIKRGGDLDLVRWVGDEVLITEARLSPLWQLRDPREAEDQGIDPRSVPRSFDPRDILDMPGTDFQGIHIEADTSTERVQIEMRQGMVDVVRLGEYRDSLRRGGAWPMDLSISPPTHEEQNSELFMCKRRMMMARTEATDALGPNDIGSLQLFEPKELPLSYTVAAALLTRASKGMEILLRDMDPSPPRHVLFPPGIVFPAG